MPRSPADGSHERAQQSPKHAQQSPKHTEEPQTTTDGPDYSAQNSSQQSLQQPKDLQSTIEESPKAYLQHTTEDDEEAPEKDDQQSLADSEEPEENLALELTHGTKRRRQMVSDSESSSTPDEDADSAAPAAMTPADPTADSTAAIIVPSQAAIAPIITFGSGAPTNSAVSSKAINRRTANDYAGTTGGMVFSCPVAECKESIDEAWTIEKFYKHLGDPLRTEYFH